MAYLGSLSITTHPRKLKLDDTLVIGNSSPVTVPIRMWPTSGPTGISLLGVSPVTGTVISLNVIGGKSIDIAVSTRGRRRHRPPQQSRRQAGMGVDNLGAGSVDATENWWGCGKGPGVRGCTTVSGANVTTTPFVTQPVQSAGTN